MTALKRAGYTALKFLHALIVSYTMSKTWAHIDNARGPRNVYALFTWTCPHRHGVLPHSHTADRLDL